MRNSDAATSAKPAHRRSALAKKAILIMAASALAACTFTENSDISNPLVRKSSWFSYLNADDLRTACSAGDAEGRIRVVYNADYYKEVRTFDIVPQPGNTQFDLTTRVLGPIEVSQIDVEVNAPLGAFGGDVSTDVLDRDSYLALTDALQADGFGYQERDGLRLNSRDFYWVALGCSSGGMTLAAWTSAKDDLGNLHFPAVLEELSGIERTLPKPPAADAPDLPDPIYGKNDRNADSRHFYRTVRGNMLR